MDQEEWEDWHEEGGYLPKLRQDRLERPTKPKLRNKPSIEDQKVRRRNNRRSGSVEEIVAGQVRRDDIVREIQKAATLDEQLALVAALEEFDRQVTLRVQAGRDLDWADTSIQERFTPVNVHELHTASTDWIGTIDTTPHDWHQKVVAEAAVWYSNRHEAVLNDPEEFQTQAEGKARHIAGAFYERSEAARRTFLDYVSFLHTGASGLDQVQQTVDANNSPKTTELPTEVFDNFAPDVDPVNQGVSGTESSDRNPLLKEIQNGSSGMDHGEPEKVGGHSTDDDLSWSPPSGMQKDTTPGWSDGDPGTPEDKDEHNTDFKSDSPFSKHTSSQVDYLTNLDDYRAFIARSADPKVDGRHGGRTASSTEGGNAADDLMGPEEEDEAKQADPVGGKVASSPEYFHPHPDHHYISDKDVPEPEAHGSPYSHLPINSEELMERQKNWSPDGSHEKHDTDNVFTRQGASGLDMIDQVIDANNQVKVTGYPTEVAFPLNNEFEPEYSTHGTGTVSKGDVDENNAPHHREAAAKPKVELHTVYQDPDLSAAHSTHIKVNGQPLDFGYGAENGSRVVPNVPSGSGPAVDQGSGYGAYIHDPTFRHPVSGHHATPQGAAEKAVDSWMDAHKSRQAAAKNDEALLRRVADMFGGSDAPHKVPQQNVQNGPWSTPDTPEQATKAKGKSDAKDTEQAPTFSDASSHVPAGVKGYSEGYASVDQGDENEKNEPGSLEGPGKWTTHAGSRTAAFNKNDTVNVNDGRGNLTGAQGRVVGGPHNDSYGTTYDVEHGDRSVKRYHETKLEHPNSERGRYESEHAKHGAAKISHLITTAADRENVEFTKGYAYATKWTMTTPIVREGSASFEAGLYAGLTDNPDVRSYFVEACKERGLTDRINRHAAITQGLADQLGVKVASTSLYLDTAAPNTSPSGDGSTPINGHGRPGPLDGKETGEEGPGGPSPYNGAAPFGHQVVPGAHVAEPVSEADKLIPQSGYTTPRAVEKASAFRRRVQAGLVQGAKKS